MMRKKKPSENTVTDHREKETDERIFNYENDELNNLFIEALNHNKEKRDFFIKFLSLHKINLQMLK